MGSATTSAECKNCHFKLAVDHKGPCPNCGQEGKLFKVTATASITMKARLAWETRHEFLETNKRAKAIVVVLTIVPPLLGLILGAIPGAILGLVASVVVYILSPYAVIRVREITKGTA